MIIFNITNNYIYICITHLESISIITTNLKNKNFRDEKNQPFSSLQIHEYFYINIHHCH